MTRRKRKQKCCCGPCNYALTCEDYPINECCGCVPKQLCVTVTPSGEQCSCDEIFYDIATYDCEAQSWTANFRCGDLQFSTEIKIEYESGQGCFLKVYSNCFTQTLSVAMNAPTSSPANSEGPTCGDLSHTFTNVAHSCGDANCQMDIAITPRNVAEVATNCDGDCHNCRCVTQKICVNVSSDTCAIFGKFDATECEPYSWDFSLVCGSDTVTGTVVLDVDEASGDCALTLTSSEGNGSAVVQDNCPDLAASWSLTDFDITVTSGDCSTCDILVGCCEGPLNPNLTGTFSNLNDCPCIDGETITLVYAGNSTWVGSIVFCGDSNVDCDYTIRLICPSNCDLVACTCEDLILQIETATRTFEADIETGTCSCDPLDIRFTWSDDLCCDSVVPASNIQLEITE